ncbi:CHAP domain-containing protein [Paenibacillus humicola]|uniref:CHAP domain-containing protein n=1 Tax=Paenibacillus humicola TaxID=3110540 RepID=UPI00237BFB57|nr:CHAP domain-containing protein [Paenibacillus humicola]
MACQGTHTRVENVRLLISEMGMALDHLLKKQEAAVHLYGVSTLASMLAMMRGQNSELASIAGLLCHYYFYKTGINDFPGPNSAEAARPLIRDTGIFTPEEQTAIFRAIFYQDIRDRVHGPFEEIIKDAIVLHHFFRKSGRQPLPPSDVKRLRRILNDLTISAQWEEEPMIHDTQTSGNTKDKRRLLADISEELASQNIIGIPDDERYREICKYWPESDIYEVLRGSWCAAFVYHCCREAGILLPIRYPNGCCRFAGVAAWLEWAKRTGFFFYDGQEDYTPERGDIVIYEKLLSDESHDHIGIVLGCDDKEILVAEGNRDNQNYSCVFRRNRRHCILGYIRIDNDYHYEFDGCYNPKTTS